MSLRYKNHDRLLKLLHLMNMESRICVVAVDGREDSDFALKWFSDHVYREGDQVVLVYVPEGHGLLHASKWENAVYTLNRDVTEEASQDELKQIKSNLERFAERLQKLRMNGRVRNVMAIKPEDGILRAAEEENAEMIVVGSRGRSKLRRTFEGSVSDYLIQHATCPVLVCARPRKRSFSAFLCTSANK